LHPSPAASPATPHAVSRTLVEVNGSTLTLETRNGAGAKIDASQAIQAKRVGVSLKPGAALTARGSSLNGAGALVAKTIVKTKSTSGKSWPPDH
jgi:hypothetical protein